MTAVQRGDCGGGDVWDRGLKRLLAAAEPPAGSEARGYSVLQLKPADFGGNGVLAVGRVVHGFADEACASSHAIGRGWRGFVVLPSRCLPLKLRSEVHEGGP